MELTRSMSNKAICPACDSYTSRVYEAFEEGWPCPVCGLAAGTAAEIENIRQSRADEKVRDDLEKALVRADRAEVKVTVLTGRLTMLEQGLSSLLVRVQDTSWKPEGWEWR